MTTLRVSTITEQQVRSYTADVARIVRSRRAGSDGAIRWFRQCTKYLNLPAMSGWNDTVRGYVERRVPELLGQPRFLETAVRMVLFMGERSWSSEALWRAVCTLAGLIAFSEVFHANHGDPSCH